MSKLVKNFSKKIYRGNWEKVECNFETMLEN